MRIVQRNTDTITIYINGEHKDVINNEFNQKLYPCTNKELIDKIKSKYDLDYIQNHVHVQLLRRWSLACARSVLHYYEDVMKKDDLRNILNDVEKIIIDRENGIFNVEVARSVAKLARSISESPIDNEESAAEPTAWVAESAVESAAESSESAAWSLWSTTELAGLTQEQKNLDLLIEILEGTL